MVGLREDSAERAPSAKAPRRVGLRVRTRWKWRGSGQEQITWGLSGRGGVCAEGRASLSLHDGAHGEVSVLNRKSEGSEKAVCDHSY